MYHYHGALKLSAHLELRNPVQPVNDPTIEFRGISRTPRRYYGAISKMTSRIHNRQTVRPFGVVSLVVQGFGRSDQEPDDAVRIHYVFDSPAKVGVQTFRGVQLQPGVTSAG